MNFSAILHFANSSSRRGISLLLVLAASSYSFGQKNITRQSLVWHGYYLNVKLDDKIQFAGEVQERHFVQPLAQHQFLLRAQLCYKLNEDWQLIVGGSNFYQSPQDPYSKSTLVVPELRAELGLSYRHNYRYFGISHRYRWETRFFRQSENDELTGGFAFSHFRLRYQLGIDVPLIKNKSIPFLTLKIREEVMFNMGHSITYNIFDQNRIYFGLHVACNQHVAFEAGYLNWWQQRSSGKDFYDRDILRLSIFHNI